MTRSVCLVVQNSYPSDVRIRKYAQTLREQGHNVCVIACRERGQAYHESYDRVEVYRIPPSRSRAGKWRYAFEYCMFFIFAFFQLNLLDLKKHFDVVHINTLPDFLVFCAVIQKLKNATIVLDMHEVMPEFFMSKYSKGMDSRFVRMLLLMEKISLRFADRVITVNHALKDLFETRVLSEGSVEVIMNTADGRVINRAPKRRHAFFNCVYHGTVTDIYGLDTAIEGFARASEGDERMLFHIYGDGPQVPKLKQLTRALGVDRKVFFHGSVPHDVIWDRLGEMDLGILACRKDVFMDLSFSNKLAEYIFLQIPVIHSNLKSIQYYFDDKDLLFFPAGDINDLAEKICFARQHPDLMQLRANTAYAKYAAMDWGVMARRYLRLIENSGVPQSTKQNIRNLRSNGEYRKHSSE